MVQVSSNMFAAATCWLLASSGTLSVFGSPLAGNGGALGPRSPAPAGLAESLPEGFKVSPIYWKGVLEEGKPEFELSGYSFDEIEAEAKAINPEYSIFTKDGKAAPGPAYNESSSQAGLSARQTFTTNCNNPSTWSPAPNWDAVWDGVHYLQGITGNCRADPGPGVCTRVSCSWNSGIFYCNDNSAEHWEPCRWIGDVAGGIVNKCNWFQVIPFFGTRQVVHGQAFDRRNWNTIVAYSSC
ncbi:hypothetical protein QBC37DRAFT_481983 [Rhypophila decipiens]|uniref:Uncharacterized protein n=1 Tax=Rhypophila decipiens TaxID=261697 RepID=A0AAN6YBC9_9PEZI|nr:hypothetical protein QBC37DRAFT_481983 [Rhypophila decipiens]